VGQIIGHGETQALWVEIRLNPRQLRIVRGQLLISEDSKSSNKVWDGIIAQLIDL
jgi:hypothetical protein